jgi:hypothetical protein
MVVEDERLKILEMIANGEISAADGVELLEALNESQVGDEEDHGGAAASSDGETVHSFLTNASDQPGTVQEQANSLQDKATPSLSPETSPEDEDIEERLWVDGVDDPVWEGPPSVDRSQHPPFSPGLEKWRRWRWIPLGVGIGVTIIGSLLMYWAYQAWQFSFWFACAWIPFLVGLGLIVLAVGIRGMRWLHLRIKQAPGEWPETIRISLPLPLGALSWLLRISSRWVPVEHVNGVRAAVLALQNTEDDQPFYLEVDEGENGERVEIYIG